MTEKLRRKNPYEDIQKTLMIYCESCCGLCCVALYFSKSEGFPRDKAAGVPCPCLAENFRCTIHKELAGRGLRGCCAFDCMGAGQQVTQAVYGGNSWRSSPKFATEMYEVFLHVWRLHQILWYLTDAASFIPAAFLEAEIRALVQRASFVATLAPDAILELDINSFQSEANGVLKRAAKLVQDDVSLTAIGKKDSLQRGSKDFMGKNLRKKDLRGKDFSAALFIAADMEGCTLRGSNLLGADLRDANLHNADLSESMFLTQGQVNGAKGDAGTKLPPSLTAPDSWML